MSGRNVNAKNKSIKILSFKLDEWTQTTSTITSKTTSKKKFGKLSRQKNTNIHKKTYAQTQDVKVETTNMCVVHVLLSLTYLVAGWLAFQLIEVNMAKKLCFNYIPIQVSFTWYETINIDIDNNNNNSRTIHQCKYLGFHRLVIWYLYKKSEKKFVFWTKMWKNRISLTNESPYVTLWNKKQQK